VDDRWSRSGRKITLYLANSEVLVGWILFEDIRQLFITFDLKRENVRLVQKHQILNFDIDANCEEWIEPLVGRKRLTHLQQFDEIIGSEVQTAMDILDTRRLRRLALRFRELALNEGLRKNSSSLHRDEVPTCLWASAELLDELERSRLLSFLQEHSDLLSEIVHEETLPGADADWADRHEIERLISDAQQHPSAIQKLDRSLVEKAQHRTWTRQDTARWTDGLGDVILGGGFAAANATAGLVAGVFTSLPTLGLGTVTAMIGVLTSTYTGLTRLKDGLTTLIHGPEDQVSRE